MIDVLHLEDLALAEGEKQYKILSGKYDGKFVDRFGNDFEEHDFCGLPITLIEKNVLTDFNLEDTYKINLESYKSKYEYEYCIIDKIGNEVRLRETDDKKIIEAYGRSVYPSVAKELMSKIEGNPNSFSLPADLVSKMLGHEDSLTLQDSNKFISIKDYNISEKYSALRAKIIGLDNELRVLLANISKNISLSYTELEASKVKELKSNILILGPRGTGKTFMIESVAELFGVPFTIEDSTRYTPAAYAGSSVEDILINLYNNSGENKELFEHGIIFLDEIDKICKKCDSKEYAIKEATQNGLLTIMRGTKLNIKIRKGFTEVPLTVDTSKLTFVLSGAFEEIIDKDNITSDDLIQYGMIPQLADRITLSIRTKNPTRENLKEALVNGSFSYIKLLEEYLSIYNIPLEVNEEFIDNIVDIAYSSNSGYRGLSRMITECLNDSLFDLYDGKMESISLVRELKGDNNE